MKESFNLRWSNGIISAFLTCFFFLHALLGSTYLLVPLPKTFAFLVWAGVAIMVIHIMVCIGTSLRMLGDKERPPSQKKKMHLALKWASGCLLMILVVTHIVLPIYNTSSGNRAFFLPVTILVICCLTWHVFIGIKSLLKDLEVDRAHRVRLRIIICCCAVLILAIMLGVGV